MPSSSERKPEPWIALKWTKRSLPPSSGVMTPYPFSAENHFTTPSAMSAFPSVRREPRRRTRRCYGAAARSSARWSTGRRGQVSAPGRAAGAWPGTAPLRTMPRSEPRRRRWRPGRHARRPSRTWRRGTGLTPRRAPTPSPRTGCGRGGWWGGEGVGGGRIAAGATAGGARFPRFVGRAAIRDRIAGFMEAVPDLSVEVLRVGEGPADTAWLEWRLTGTHRRDWGAWIA